MRGKSSIPWVAIALITTALAGIQNGCAPNSYRGGASRTVPDSALANGDTAAALQNLEERAGDPAAPPETFLLLGRLCRSRGSITDRLRAQGILEDGLRRYPDHPGLLAELGATYYAQTLYGDAERVFRRVLEIEPDRCDAHYYLGINAYRKWRHVQSYTEYLHTAERHLGIAAACDPAMEDAFLKLAVSQWVLGDTARAVETCATYRTAHPADPEPLFLSGCIAYASGDFETCRDRFDGAFSLMGEEERMIFADVSVLLRTDEEKDAYASAPPSDKIETQRLYWVANDPDPTTEVNERLLEHVYRVFLSGLRYASSTPPIDGWETSRGKALIKFGEPDHVETTLEGVTPLDGRTEIWTYLEAEQPFVLLFRDEYLNGNYLIPIEDVISAWTLREDPPLTAHVPEAADVPGSLEAVAFRESDTAARVYLAYAADADSLDHQLWTWHTERFRMRTAVYLRDGRPYEFIERTLRADSLATDAASARPSYVAVEELLLPFDSYRLAFCLEDDHEVTRSVAWADLATSRFIGKSLASSDILLCSRARPGQPSIRRPGRILHINPTGRCFPGEDLLLYLEVYNLALRDGRSRYELSYSIRRADSKRGLRQTVKRAVEKSRFASAPPPVILQTFERVGTSDSVEEEIAVEIGSLEPGAYEVTVTTVDTATADSVSVSKTFVKVGDDPSGRE